MEEKLIVPEVSAGVPAGTVAFPDPRRPWVTQSLLDKLGVTLEQLTIETPLCWGGDLSPERLALAYSFGIFPWISYRRAMADGLEWWCPLTRFVIFPEKLHISHSLRTLLNKRRYRVTVNEAFPEVIRACRMVNDRDDDWGAWLGPEMERAYTRLWDMGLARSVEVRDTEDADRLVGGLYGVYINGCFMGESMFSLVASGSKVALVGLAEWLKQQGGKLIDCQFETPHLRSMGAEPIDYATYLRHLNPTSSILKES